ncbi:MAG: hypothetical protein AB1758_27580 [Candidatus Eremiobacterota bacterium]
MRAGEWQAFIPGWNVIYMLRERRKMDRADQQRQDHLVGLHVQGASDQRHVESLVAQRELYHQQGQHGRARECDEAIARLVMQRIDQLS